MRPGGKATDLVAEIRIGLKLVGNGPDLGSFQDSTVFNESGYRHKTTLNREDSERGIQHAGTEVEKLRDRDPPVICDLPQLASMERREVRHLLLPG